jgi:hypothetical protein
VPVVPLPPWRLDRFIRYGVMIVDINGRQA